MFRVTGAGPAPGRAVLQLQEAGHQAGKELFPSDRKFLPETGVSADDPTSRCRANRGRPRQAGRPPSAPGRPHGPCRIPAVAARANPNPGTPWLASAPTGASASAVLTSDAGSAPTARERGLSRVQHPPHGDHAPAGTACVKSRTEPEFSGTRGDGPRSSPSRLRV